RTREVSGLVVTGGVRGCAEETMSQDYRTKRAAAPNVFTKKGRLAPPCFRPNDAGNSYFGYDGSGGWVEGFFDWFLSSGFVVLSGGFESGKGFVELLPETVMWSTTLRLLA